jgi:hypothetical protein
LLEQITGNILYLKCNEKLFKHEHTKDGYTVAHVRFLMLRSLDTDSIVEELPEIKFWLFNPGQSVIIGK